MAVAVAPLPIALLLFGTLGLALLGEGCAAQYKSALGYRARQAAIREDVDEFEALMAEAVKTRPQFPLDNPTRTVLSHFLALGGHDRFFPTVDAWLSKGWISDRMSCAIHRARYRGVKDRKPEEALESALFCVRRARDAAMDPELRWEVDACLEDAPFLTETSTVSLRPFLAEVLDASAPRLFRAAMLEAQTKQFSLDLRTRLQNEPELAKDEARRATELEVLASRRRFEAILSLVGPHTDEALLTSATAFGALEIERAGQTIEQSLVADYAEGDDALSRDLAWGWVRSMKRRKAISRLAPLGIWDRRLEPQRDAAWFMCFREEPPRGPRTPRDGLEARTGPVDPVGLADASSFTVIAVLAKGPGSDVAAGGEDHGTVAHEEARQVCGAGNRKSAKDFDFEVIGPFPMASTGRTRVRSILASRSSGRRPIIEWRTIGLSPPETASDEAASDDTTSDDTASDETVPPKTASDEAVPAETVPMGTSGKKEPPVSNDAQELDGAD